MIDRFTASLITILLLGLLRYFNWYGLLNRYLRRIESYILGTLAIVLPFLGTTDKENAITLITVVLSGGITVVGFRMLDKLIKYRWRAIEAEERERGLKEVSDHEPKEDIT